MIRVSRLEKYQPRGLVNIFICYDRIIGSLGYSHVISINLISTLKRDLYSKESSGIAINVYLLKLV